MWTGCTIKPGSGSRATGLRQPAAVDEGLLRGELPDRRAADGPAEDPLATAAPALRASRERILATAAVIIPGHGPAFRPSQDTPR